MSAHIGVVHMDLASKGGGEAVAMAVLEALQDDYEVTLLTLTDPDWAALNEYFNTSVDSVEVRRAGLLAPGLHAACGLDYYVLQNAFLSRYARRHADEFDLLVSTINELGLGDDAVQYVHFPFDWTVSMDNREDVFHPSIETDSLYERLCPVVAGASRERVTASTLIANSEWTADAVEDAYGTRPRVLHPPIDTSDFVDRPWADREEGFVAIGRIERSKRVLELIRIVDAVRERGHDVHLHVIGPTVDETYRDEVASAAADRAYVEFEGEVSREALVERICTHRYGLHGKEHEHFGMSVAEIAAGGAIPFVPAGGGQTDVVADEETLTYESVDDAAASIDRVLSSPERQRELRMGPDEIERTFGRERFERIVSETVAAEIDEGGSPAPERLPDSERATDRPDRVVQD